MHKPNQPIPIAPKPEVGGVSRDDLKRAIEDAQDEYRAQRPDRRSTELPEREALAAELKDWLLRLTPYEYKKDAIQGNWGRINEIIDLLATEQSEDAPIGRNLHTCGHNPPDDCSGILSHATMVEMESVHVPAIRAAFSRGRHIGYKNTRDKYDKIIEMIEERLEHWKARAKTAEAELKKLSMTEQASGEVSPRARFLLAWHKLDCSHEFQLTEEEIDALVEAMSGK